MVKSNTMRGVQPLRQATVVVANQISKRPDYPKANAVVKEYIVSGILGGWLILAAILILKQVI